MNPRTERLRRESLDAVPTLSAERAELLTAFYRENLGRHSKPALRARAFHFLCERKTIWIGEGELIVGERGERPKAVPTYPELTCHSLEDLRILDSRPLTSYRVPPGMLEAYEETVIPFWRGRSLRDRIFPLLPPDWHAAYGAGVFTEFMEQRAPGHTVLDDKIYRKGLLDFKAEIAKALAALDEERDPWALDKREELTAMEIACDAVLLFARRHAARAEELAESEKDAGPEEGAPAHRRGLPPRPGARAARLSRSAPVVLVLPPRRHHRAERLGRLQPGAPRPASPPVLSAGPRRRHADEEAARELIECFFVKFNNHPAPPEGGSDGGRERDVHRLREHQPRRAPPRRLRRLERGDAPSSRGDRRDAPPPALLERADLAEDPGHRPQGGPPRRPEGVRLPVALQRRRGRRGAAPAGEDARGRPRGGVQRLRGGGRLRQGGLHPDRLLQPREGARAGAPRRSRSAER